MSYKKKLLAPMVSAAIVLIAVTNYCIIEILRRPGQAANELFWAIWPIALTTSVAVILIMSTLYHALQEVVEELEQRRLDALDEAQRDVLTGLANKRLLAERLEQAIARYRRTGEAFSLLMLDLDHFKRVNDLHGHQTGDELLKQAAARLTSLARETDTIARFGGDEFLVLQTNVKKHSDVRRLCARIAQRLRAPYILNNHAARLAASIGGVISSDLLHSPSDYVRAADMALYAAKGEGRNCYRFFTKELDAQLRRKDMLETDLRRALESGDGVGVKFQPQLNARGEVFGAEALFRWSHSELGEIPAAEAVTVAEESHLIEALGEFVLREAARFARRWPRLSVAVNISPLQFTKTDELADVLLRTIASEGVDSKQIELEITEQLFMREDGICDAQVQRLRECGFRVALDDFGTGYSSLSYLRRFKVDRLKLDRSFACDAELQESVAVIRAAVLLAHSLGLEVVAEGIESELQEAVALEAGCDGLQGNRYGGAMTANEFAYFLRHRGLKAA